MSPYQDTDLETTCKEGMKEGDEEQDFQNPKPFHS